MESYHIGIDVGGTNIKAVLVDEMGRTLAFTNMPLHMASQDEFIGHIKRICHDVISTAGVSMRQVSDMGMGIPGEVDACRQIIVHTCNLPFENLKIGELVKRNLGIPVFLDNDANCAAWGERYAGVGRDVQDFIMITLGTGIGAGIISNGRVFRGCNGMAGEVGHMVIERNGLPCTCGRRGCWEQYASATGLIRLTREYMERDRESALWRTCEGDISRVEGKTLFQTLERGYDATAQKVYERYMDYLSTGIANLINLFQPEMIAIGGGISHADDALLLYPLRTMTEQQVFGASPKKRTEVAKAQLGNQAGSIGAAYLYAAYDGR